MIYELGEHRTIINGYMFETDTESNIYVYNKKFKYLDSIKSKHKIGSEKFEHICKNWIKNNY